MKSFFTVKPKHWWDYLNPFWWRRKRVIEAVIAYQWETKGLEKKMNKAITDAVLYGEGKMPIDWEASPPDGEKP